MEQSYGLSGCLTSDARILLVLVAQFVRMRLSEDNGKKAPDSKFFQYDEQAYRLAKGMCRMAVRSFWKSKIIPAGFYLWLQANRFLPHSFVIPLGGSTVEILILNLRRFGVEAKQILRYLEARSGLQEEKRGHQIKAYCNPELKNSFGTQQGTWTAIDNMRQMRHVRRPR